MKKTSKFKSKKYPRLKKYLYGDTVDGGLTPMTVPEDPSLRPYSAPAESAAVTQQKQQQAQLQANANAQAKKEKNAANASTAVNVGSAAVSGGIGMYNAFSNPNSTMAQKQAATNATTDAVVGAINPIAGTITGVAHQIADPIKADLEKTDSSGNLVNESGARTGAIIGSWLDPVQAISTRASYDGGWTDITGKGYTAQLEKEAKDRIASEKAYNDQIAAQEKQKQDQINKQIESGIQSGIKSYYENPDNNKNQSQTFAMGGIPQMPNSEFEKPNSEVQGGEIITSKTPPKLFSNGGIKLVSNNPYSDPTYETKGPGHDETNSVGTKGMPVFLERGSNVNGWTKVPDYMSNRKGETFDNHMKKHAIEENKIVKLSEKFSKKAQNGDKYSKNASNVMLPILDKKLKEFASYKDYANNVQNAIIDNKKQLEAINRGELPPQGMPDQSQNGMVMARYGAQMKYRMGGMQMLPKYDGGGYSDASGSYDSQGNMIAGPMGEILGDSQYRNAINYGDSWNSDKPWGTTTQGQADYLNDVEESRRKNMTAAARQRLTSASVANATPAIVPAATPQSPIGDPSKGYYVNGVWNAYPTYARSTPEGTFNAAGEQTSDAYGRPMMQTFAPIQSIQTDPNNPKIVTNLTNKIQAEKNLQNSFNKDVAPRADGSMPAPNPKDYSNYKDYARQAAIFAGQNLGNISDLIRTRGGRKYDRESYGQMTPQMPDYTEAKRNARSEASAYRRMLPGLTGGNAGATLGMMGQLQGLSQQALAKIVEGEQQARTGVYNQFLPLNKQLQMQERADTQANKARSEDIARMATSGIAATIGGAGADYGMSKNQKEQLALITNAYPDYAYDDKKKGWYHKDTKEKLDPTKVQAATTTGK